ncbi:MAG: MgtC/SapB family protein [Dehalococcoidia bacterium]|nr:MgtC/SapB family protein [Dehalococcoidia bacterium]
MIEAGGIQTDTILLLRAAVAAALGFVVGWARERRGSAAGDRTYAMVALGAAAFTAVAVDDFGPNADRLIAGIVTGVGFLGAGVILRQGTGEVKGLTTAASIWAVAAVGVIVGTGDYLMGAAVCALVLIILEWDHIPLLQHLGQHHTPPLAPDDREREEP